MIDYQIQTTASDGKFSPRECVKMARDNGLISIAITDHDTVGGIPEALEAGKEFGIEVIPGIEFSCSYLGKMIHILGFGINIGSSNLTALIESARLHRDGRAQRMVEKLNELGFFVSYERVKDRARGVVARPHIADEVMGNPQNAKKLKQENILTKQDFFDAYIGETGRAAPAADPLSPRSAIEAIHKAGGISIWSHPTWPAPNHDFPWVEKTLKEFMKARIDGLEAFNYTPEADTHFLFGLAEKEGLLKTAGSDFHDLSLNTDTGLTTKIGGYPTFGYSIEGIREALLAAIQRQKAAVASV